MKKELLSGLVLFILTSVFFSSFAFATSVTTDKSDYSPGETVIITGLGFIPGSINLTIVRPDSSVNHYTPTANSSGIFVYNYQLDGILGTYSVYANDGTNYETVTFTDASTHTSLDSITTPLTASQTGVSWSGSVHDSNPGAGTNDVELRYVDSGDPCPVGASGTLLALASTNSGGLFSGTFTAPAADAYQFYARFNNLPGFGASESDCQTITVNAAQVCGNGIVEGTEVCDDGANNGQPNHCNAQCTGTTTPICGNGVLESGEQCESPFGSCCDSGTCQFKSSSIVCRASAGVCDIAETCTGSSATCPTDQFQPSGTSCDDVLYCNGHETCDGAGTCQSGTTVSCTANNILGIATCDNNPDNVHYTWDSRNPFTSICNEATDICTTGSETITHTCNKATCGAQCETNADCNDNNAQTIDTCNLASCGCEHVAPKAVPAMSPILMISLLASLVAIAAKKIKV